MVDCVVPFVEGNGVGVKLLVGLDMFMLHQLSALCFTLQGGFYLCEDLMVLQFFESASSNERAIVDHQYLMRVLNVMQRMGDQQNGLAFEILAQCFEEDERPTCASTALRISSSR